jgi:predicted transcriptional regulator
MPNRPEHLPTHYERAVLQKLSAGAAMPARNLDPTESGRTLSKLLAKGWIEQNAASRNFRITSLGKEALRTLLP